MNFILRSLAKRGSLLALNMFSAINNCMDAFPTSGIVKILNHGLDPFPVYCDQTNDEGGDLCYFLLIVDVSRFIAVFFS